MREEGSTDLGLLGISKRPCRYYAVAYSVSYMSIKVSEKWFYYDIVISPPLCSDGSASHIITSESQTSQWQWFWVSLFNIYFNDSSTHDGLDTWALLANHFLLLLGKQEKEMCLFLFLSNTHTSLQHEVRFIRLWEWAHNNKNHIKVHMKKVRFSHFHHSLE